MTLENPVLSLIARGGVARCMSVRLARGVEIALLAKNCGFEALYVDVLHSTIDIETAGQMCIAAKLAGIGALVRVPEDPAYISRVLDAGALGVIIPQVDTKEQAERIAGLSRFPPRGERSVPGVGAILGYEGSVAEAAEALDAATMVVAMIESPEGVRNAREIAAVPGIDCLLVGSTDLRHALDAAGETGDAAMTRSYEIIAEACRESGAIFGIAGVRNDEDKLGHLIGMGARFVTAGNDEAFVRAEGRRQADFLGRVAEAAGNGAANYKPAL